MSRAQTMGRQAPPAGEVVRTELDLFRQVQEVERLDLQRGRILDRLRQGPATARELNDVAFSYRQRISELRKPEHGGHVVVCTRHNRRTGETVYQLLKADT